MGWLSDWKRDRAVERAARAFADGADAAGEAALAPLGAGGDVLPRVLAAFRLKELGHADIAGAQVALALAADPAHRGALLLSAELASEAGRGDAAAAAARVVLDRSPGDVAAADVLCDALLQAGRFKDVLQVLEGFRARPPEPALLLAGVRALKGEGHLEQAWQLATGLARSTEQGGLEFETASTSVDVAELRHLLSDLAAEVRAQAPAGGQTPEDGALVDGDPPPFAHAVAPDATAAAAHQARQDGEDAESLVLLAEVELRHARLDDALALYRHAAEVLPQDERVLLGLSAVRRLREGRSAEVWAQLGEGAELGELAQVVVPFEALSALERRVVSAAAQPLRSLLGSLALRGARIDVLAPGCAPGDVPTLANAESADEPGGAACRRHHEGDEHPTSGAVPVLSLLDVDGPGAWKIAHELGHLVVAVLSETQRAELGRLHARAVDVGYACDARQLASEVEYFAMALTDLLRLEHGMPLLREADDDGVLDESVAFVRGLAATE